MSVKKFLILTAAGIVSLGTTAAIAGGPDMMAPPAPVDYSGVYIEGDIGWAQVNWGDFWAGALNSAPVGLGLASGAAIGAHRESGFTYGGDLGYQFNRYFSAEAGWYHLPTVAGEHSSSSGSNLDPIVVRSWLVYFAGKVAIPVADDFDIFGKAGIVWRKLDYSGPAVGLAAITAVFHDTHYSKPFFAFGAQWFLDQNWSANIQYMVVPGYYRAAEIAMQAPKANLVVGGIGYKFAV